MTAEKHMTHRLALALAATLSLPTLAWAQSDDAASSEAAPSSSEDAKEEASDSKEAAEERRDKRNEELADRIKSVQRKVFLKKDRLEIYPFFAMDINDPLYQHFVLGGSVSYHFVDSLALEARGGGVLGSVQQDIVRLIRQNNGAVLENPPQFKAHADLDLTWAPLYGKLSVLGEGLLHFDTFLTGGPGIFVTDLGVAPAFNIGIGQRYFLTKWLVARVELRNYVFIEERNERSSLQNLMLVSFSVSGFFPTSFEYEFQ
jgi:outer membrane beta-barrel protein